MTYQYNNEDHSYVHDIQPGQDKVAHEGDVDIAMAKAACQAAYERVMEFEANSKLINQPNFEFHDVARLEWDDVCVEGLLGVGGFACVCKVSVPCLDAPESDDESPSENKSQASGSSSSSASCGIYALKCLNVKTTMDPKAFTTGAADLASEFLFLSNLSHPNIVRCYGVSKACVSRAFEQGGGYFILLEHLRGTVSDLLRLWREDLKQSGKANKIPSSFDRIQQISLGIARGMEYLHSHEIILRDLKPHNVGFDRSGSPRIFDFGLAREVFTDSSTTSKAITGVAGSWRYMSVECALGRGCVYASDVWSYSMLLWELLTLEKPFSKISGPDEYVKKVASGGTRPGIATIPTQGLKDLLKDCWETDPEKRPDFASIIKTLDIELDVNSDQLRESQKLSWRQQIAALKKSVKSQIREMRRNSLQM